MFPLFLTHPLDLLFTIHTHLSHLFYFSTRYLYPSCLPHPKQFISLLSYTFFRSVVYYLIPFPSIWHSVSSAATRRWRVLLPRGRKRKGLGTAAAVSLKRPPYYASHTFPQDYFLGCPGTSKNYASYMHFFYLSVCSLSFFNMKID